MMAQTVSLHMPVEHYQSLRETMMPINWEFLALKWSIAERFHEYLYGGHFAVYMDNNPLTYILTTAKLDATSLSIVSKFSTEVENSM